MITEESEITVERGLDERGFQRVTVTSPKLKSKIFVQKTRNGYSQYEVYFEKGALPNALSGQWTTPDKAIKEISRYLSNKQESAATLRDKKYERNHAPAASKDNSERI